MTEPRKKLMGLSSMDIFTLTIAVFAAGVAWSANTVDNANTKEALAKHEVQSDKKFDELKTELRDMRMESKASNRQITNKIDRAIEIFLQHKDK